MISIKNITIQLAAFTTSTSSTYIILVRVVWEQGDE